MMTREQIKEIVDYIQEHGITISKERLALLQQRGAHMRLYFSLDLE